MAVTQRIASSVYQKINDLLKDWAQYARGSIAREIGYKSYSIEHTMKHYGGSAPKGIGNVVITHWPEHVTRVEKAICELPYDYRVAVVIRYCHEGTWEDNARAYEKRIGVKVSEQTFRNTIMRTAIGMIWGKVSDDEAAA